MLGNWSLAIIIRPKPLPGRGSCSHRFGDCPRIGCGQPALKIDKGEIATDEEAARAWRRQPGIVPDHVVYFGRKDNFWEMADIGPCGPCSEIHLDRGLAFCDRQTEAGHVCHVNGDCKRFLELWNLVFIQYNRLSPTQLEPLPARHVDTGMGLERIVSVLQGVNSNYATDLLSPFLDTVQSITGHTHDQREANLTPYRVIADHGRATAFLIADGVVPGNTGRNYVCRMIIRRAARFGSKIGLNKPFLAQVAQTVITNLWQCLPRIKRNQAAILNSITREEERFQRTVESGISRLDELLQNLDEEWQGSGWSAGFRSLCYIGAAVGINRDIAREEGLDVDEEGFRQAMEEHRLASGAGKAFGAMGGEDVGYLPRASSRICKSKWKVKSHGIEYDPYGSLEVEGAILALARKWKCDSIGQPG